MNIAVISPNFPYGKSISFVFVEQLCREFVDMGHNVIVISPQSLTYALMRRKPLAPRQYSFTTKKGSHIKVYRPYYLSFSNSKFSVKQFNRSVNRTLNSIDNYGFDIVYGHFWESAFAGLNYAKKKAIPLFAVAGEDYVIFDRYIKQKEKETLSRYVKACICVSTKSKEESVTHGLISEKDCIIIPNAINPSLFYKKDKYKLRSNYKIDKDDFIVAFVGQFTNRKGTLRLSKALEEINNDIIKALFIGSGPEKPIYKNTIVNGTIKHDLLPDYLNMADAFVLPTLSEGCCNAIVEAMACGLPIISTDASFNWDILNESNSILINPNSIKEIKTGIERLYNDKELCNSLSEGALKTAKNLTLEKRAKRIIDFIQGKIVLK